jgi:hypothetical protein
MLIVRPALFRETDERGFDKKNDCTSSVGKKKSEKKLILDIMLLGRRKLLLMSLLSPLEDVT